MTTFIVLVILLLLCVFWSIRTVLYYRTKLILGPDTTDISIYIKPDDSATRAAANYLSFAIEQNLDKEIRIVTEKEENGHYLCILCETETELSDEAPAYSITIDHGDMMIRVPQRSRCFGVVKAVADRWLQEDCGKTKNDELRLSQAMIDQELSFLSTAVAGEFRILTQNLRCADDGEGRTVAERADRFFQLVEEYQPDLIGTQECTWEWLQLLQKALSDRYEIYGCSRLGPDTNSGEWNAVLYRKDRFVFQDGETFWLSNTPSQATSKLNYDGAVRICTWALLRDSETGKVFLFSNTHLQNGISEFDQEIRSRQTEILLRQLRKGNMLTIYPGFLTGDFNGESEERFYSELTAYYEDSEPTAITNSSAVNYSYHNYGSSHTLIDFCFHSPNNVGILDYKILDDQYSGYVSDHYGIFITAVVF